MLFDFDEKITKCYECNQSPFCEKKEDNDGNCAGFQELGELDKLKSMYDWGYDER